MNSVIIFDTSDNETVKNGLETIGYKDIWISSMEDVKEKYNLPPNTVWKKDIELKSALVEFKQIVNSLNITRLDAPIIINSCIVLPSAPWEGIPSPFVKV
jgi:hypothetical protein